MIDKIEIMPAHEFILEDELKNIISKIQKDSKYCNEIKAKGEYKNKIEM